MDNQNDDAATARAEKPKQDDLTIRIPRNKRKIIFIAAAAIAVIAVSIFVYGKFAGTPTVVTSMTVTPTEIVESFKIVSLELYYNELINSQSTEDRKLFGFIQLESAEKWLIVQISGKVFMGIDIDKRPIQVVEQYDGSQKILKLTIPKAEIIAHEIDRPLVLFNEANHMENYTLEEYIDLQDAAKLEVNAKINNGEFDGAIDRAQESAKTQLQSFLNSIPDIRDNYRLDFVLE
jgi:hypothetical protein